jgi:hypothetical protein
LKYTAAELADTFGEVLAVLATVLEGEGLDWMLVGGLAVGVWTEPRGTKDCDVAVALGADVTSLARRFEEAGLRVARGDLRSAREGGVVRMRFEREGAPSLVVDLLCSGTPFEREAIARRRRIALFGKDAFAATPDDLVIYKLVAGRPQDLADIDRLFRFGRSPEDEAYLRRWAREWDVEDRLDRALEQSRRDDE